MSTAISTHTSSEPRTAARLAAALDPTYRLSTGRLIRIRGPVGTQRIVAVADRLSTPDKSVAEVEIGHAKDPVLDATSHLVDAPDPVSSLRCRVYRVDAEDHLLLLAGHPAWTDHRQLAGWGEQVRALFAEEPADPPCESDSHGSRPGAGEAAEVETDAKVDVEADWAYWRGLLTGELPQWDLTGRARSVTGAEVQPGHRRTVTARPQQAERWRELADRLGIGGDALALTAVALLLRRYLGATDLILSLAVAGAAGRPETALPLRLELHRDADAAVIAGHVAERLAQALEHRGMGPDELVRRLNPPRVGGRTPLDQVRVVLDTLVVPGHTDAFAIHHALGETGDPVPAGAVSVQPVALRRGYVPGELALNIVTRTDRPRLTITHPPRVPATLAAGLGRDLGTLLDELAAGRQPRHILAVPTGVRRRWPAPARAHRDPTASARRPVPVSGGAIAARFHAVAIAQPDRVAVLTEDAVWSYAGLAERAGGYAAAIAAAGAGRGDRVGLLLDQGIESIAAILGTLAAGATYVPMDPSYPTERLRYIEDDADLRVLVTTRERARAAGAMVYAETIVAHPYAPNPASEPDDPAYLLYTSGSTGRPKGVIQTHRGVLAGIANHITNFALTPDDRLSMLASFSYDMAVSDLFGAVLAGAAVAPVDVRRSGLTRLLDRLAADEISVYHSTPTLFRYLTDALGPTGRLPAVRAVLLGGEEATADDVRRARRHFADDCVFVNGYGATEATFAVQHHIGPTDTLDRTGLPIGYPLPGYEIELRDPQGQPAALLGELVIRSPYVASGYWRQPGLTRERFGAADDGTRWYRTGDLARRLPDGRLVYQGRLDRQVKVRGYRVELGDIEAHLAARPEVVRAVAFARPNAVGEPELFAYAQATPGSDPDGAELKADLSLRLPDFAVPRTVVVCAELPLTATGKVDVAALPTPALAAGPAQGDAPRTGTERLIAAAWCAALGVAEVGVAHNFFDAGGHSLLMAVVQRELAESLGRQLPLVMLFAHPTVAGLAAALDASLGGSPDGSTPAPIRAPAALPARPVEPLRCRWSPGSLPGAHGVGDGSAGLAERMARRREARSRHAPPAGREVAG